jgi:phage terminase large subunit-like protein
MVGLEIAPWQLLAIAENEGAIELSDLELASLWYDACYTLRPEQWPEHDDWNYLGYVAGRGWGKSFAIAAQVNMMVERGEVKSFAMMAQDEARTLSLQVAPLIASSPPWFKAELKSDMVIWPNGVHGMLYTPESPGKIRGLNAELVWLSELVAWPGPTRLEAFNNVTTATREGKSRVVWDTTSKGRNEVIDYMKELNELNPYKYPIIRGHIGDNPLYGRDYLAREFKKYKGRAFFEELEGAIYSEAQGAIYEQAWIDANRAPSTPSGKLHRVCSLDPGVSTKEGVDGTGLIVGCRNLDGVIYVETDYSAVLSPEGYGEIIFREHARRAAGVVVETNKGGRTVFALLKALGTIRGIDVRLVEGADLMPEWSPTVLYVREVFSRDDKLARGAGPSAMTANGKVKFVGTFSSLERQLCTYDGEGKSPNNFDAFNQLVTELGELKRKAAPPAARNKRVAGESAASAMLKHRLSVMRAGRRLV